MNDEEKREYLLGVAKHVIMAVFLKYDKTWMYLEKEDREAQITFGAVRYLVGRWTTDSLPEPEKGWTVEDVEYVVDTCKCWSFKDDFGWRLISMAETPRRKEDKKRFKQLEEFYRYAYG